MWLDNSKVRVVNFEGNEKVIDIHDNLKQISYGTVPMLDVLDFMKSGDKVTTDSA